MPITLPAVPPAYTSPRYDDKVVQDIQQDFAANLSWLTRAYHIAREGIKSDTKQTFPIIHSNVGDNNGFSLMPDNKCPAYCYFEVPSPYEPDHYEGTVTYNLSVTFWGYLTLIDGVETQDFTSQLIQDVVKRLDRKQAYNIVVEERPEEIFNNFTLLKQEFKQNLWRKYTAFKINFTLLRGIKDDC